MIEENVTFETAIQSSYQKMKDFCCQLDMQFEMIELMHLSNMMFETTVDELVSSALSIFSDIAKTIPEENTQNRYEVPLSNVSPKLSDTLEHLGILTLAEKLSTVESFLNYFYFFQQFQILFLHEKNLKILKQIFPEEKN